MTSRPTDAHSARLMIAEYQHRKLLVVDDEPLVRQTLDFCLRDEYDVTTAASGEEAIELARKEEFPVVILDLRMEGLSGIETLKKLKELHELQNVIILTAYESMESAITALNLGAFNYLTKPFERTHLREVISRGFEAYDQQHLRKKAIHERLMNVHDSFLSLLCHEFNTPLNAIIGVSELLVDTQKDPEQKTWMQDIHEAGLHLHGILMEMVDYIGASHLASTGIENNFVIASLLQPLIETLRKDELKFEIEEGPALHHNLRGASSSIFMIARKLVRMASHQSKNVKLRAELGAHQPHGFLLKLEVSGTGIHLEQNEVEKLFHPYQFTPHTGTGNRSSLGLELATCRKIAEYAQGSVNCLFTASGEIVFSALIPVGESDKP